MTDIVERLRNMDEAMGMKSLLELDAAAEIERLRREISTLRNFLGAIDHNVRLALGDYGQPTGKLFTDEEIEKTRHAMATLGGTYRWVVPPGEKP